MKTKSEIKDLGKEYLNKADAFIKEKLNSTLKMLGCSIALGIIVVFFWKLVLSLLFFACIAISIYYFKAPDDTNNTKE